MLTAGVVCMDLTLAGCATTSDTTDETSESADTGSEFSQGETPAADMVTDASSGSMQLGTAYFDYNRSEIRGDMRDVLKANAEVLIIGTGGGRTPRLDGAGTTPRVAPLVPEWRP